MVDKDDRQKYDRQRLDLDDGDFLDLDWLTGGTRRLAILSHGLEGNSQSHYVKAMARHLLKMQWDVLAWNFRGCSGEANKTTRSYHMGDTADLAEVVSHASSKEQYNCIVLIGFSIGGSMTLKYLGGGNHPNELQGAITFSVPCSFSDTIKQLKKLSGRPYSHNFLKKIRRKLHRQSSILGIDESEIKEINSIETLTERIILPIYGFSSLEEYDSICSCLQYLDKISVPTFIGNALNDPLLGPDSYPLDLAREHPYIYLETPKYGGHCGFNCSKSQTGWMENRAQTFLDEEISSKNAINT